MGIVKDKGILLISIYFLLFGAYNIIYARILLAALEMVYCEGTECIMLGFLRMVAWILGFVGICQILASILIRLHRLGGYLALVTSCFNVILMLTYLTKLSTMPIWLTFILPVRILLTESLSSPATKDFLSVFEGSLEILVLLLNLVVIAYLIKSFGRGLWGRERAQARKEDKG